jgi:hypothetical protein
MAWPLHSKPCGVKISGDMSDPILQPLPPPNEQLKRDNTLRNGMLACALVLTCSVSYYFVVALPSTNRMRFDLERQKYEDLKAEKAAKAKAEEEAEANRQTKVLGCQGEADRAYWDYVKLNGKPLAGKPGTYSAPTSTWDQARRRKEDSYKECMAL